MSSDDASELDPAYLWNLTMGRIPPTTRLCEKCGEMLVDDSGHWLSYPSYQLHTHEIAVAGEAHTPHEKRS